MADHHESELGMADRDDSEADLLVTPAELGDLEEGSEADVLDQIMLVEEHQVSRPSPNRAEVPEADWLEQSIEVPVDDEQEER